MRDQLLLLICFLLPSLLFAQEKKVALVIGNSNYLNGAPLANPENDAEDIGEKLKAAGFDVSRYVDLSQTEMRKVIDEFGGKLDKADVALFFYAGHGVQAKGKNYLIPIDASLKTENDVEYNCVDAGRILAKMEDANTRTNIVILDACRNNPFERSWSRNSQGNGLAYMDAPGGSLIAYSTAPGKTASDGYYRNSPFTSGLLEYMGTPNLNIEALFKLVRVQVMNNTNGEQIPWESTSLTGDFYFNTDQDKGQAKLVDILPEYKESLIEPPDYESQRQELAEGIRSIAILPFANYTGDDGKTYLAMGIQEALTTELGKLGNIKVMSRTSTMSYQGFQKTIKEIASELDVDGVIEASLLGGGDKIMVQLKLYSAFPDELLLWTDTYESDLSEVYSLYTEVVSNIAGEIQLTLSPEQKNRLNETRSVNPEAYKAYLNGKFHLFNFTEESQAIAQDYFKKSTEIDPEYAPAWAGIAGIWIVLQQFGFVSHEVAAPIIHDNISKAVSYNNNDPDVYFWKALMDVWTDFDWEEGEKSFLKCLELNSNYSEAWAYYSHLLMCTKRGEEMRETMKKARELDPFNPTIIWFEGVEWLAEEKYDLVLERFEPINRMDPDNPMILGLLVEVYSQTGDYDKAIEIWGKRFEQWGLGKLAAILVEEYKTSGFQSSMAKVAVLIEQSSEFFPESELMSLYGYGGNREKLLYWYERAYFRNSPDLPYMGVWPFTKPYRSDPRFREILRKMKIPGNNLN